MAATGSLDWIFTVAGGLVVACGSVLLLWALFWDRARGRRRCGRCWYDMTGAREGTAGHLRCPECGAVARRESRLRRTRRRWKWAAVALLVVLAGRAVMLTPEYRRGWQRVIPMTVLVELAAPADPIRPPSFVPGTFFSGVTPVPTSFRRELTEAVWTRFGQQKFWGWQGRRFFSRYFDANPVEFGALVSVPERWPLGEPIVAGLRPIPAGGLTYPRTKTRLRLAKGGNDVVSVGTPVQETLSALEAPTDVLNVELDLILGRLVVHSERLVLPCRVGGTPADFLDQDATTETTALVREALTPRLILGDERPVVRVADRSDTRAWRALDLGVAYRIELVEDGRVLATGAGAAEWDRAVWKDWEEIELEWTGTDRPRAVAALKVVITGDPVAAGYQYMKSPLTKARAACWTGSIEFGPD